MNRVKLSEVSTVAPKDWNKEDTKERTELLTKRLDELQNLLFAEGKHSVLIVLQGMDASGKDGLIRKVFQSINPMGCRVTSWKKPTDEEMAHDFLWRIHKEVPRLGMIQIFNRSHYEDVLVQRVHKWVDEETISRRFDSINAFERLLQENNVGILKFYLHVSHQEQLDRLRERLTDPRKMWKHNPRDMEESARWDAYWAAYEDVFHHCSPAIPWTIVPSDQNWVKEHVVAETLVKHLESLNMSYPVHPS